nr:hypothetical protein [Tanacetum cinerariifolium]
MWETDSYKTHEDHTHLFEALENSMNRDHSEELAQDLAEARKKKKKSRESPKTPPGSPTHHPPPLPPPAGPSRALGAPGAFRSPQVPPPLPPPPSSTNQDKERPATPEPAWSIPSSDKPASPKSWASALASNYSPPPEDSLLAQTGDMATFIDWFCKRRGITELKPQDLEGPAFKIIKLTANLQQALTSGTQTDKASVYDSDGSVEVHNYENCYDNEIFNMFTQEEQYT